MYLCKFGAENPTAGLEDRAQKMQNLQGFFKDGHQNHINFTFCHNDTIH